MKQVYNFNAGPAALPREVLEKAKEELLDFEDTGISIMEHSHRGKHYEAVHEEAKSLLKELLSIPNEYEILFLQGGASLQFAMIPMNFMKQNEKAGYILTGSWSEKALKEAKKIGEAEEIVSGKSSNYSSIPEIPSLSSDDYTYVHVTSNNTIFGTQWASFDNLEHPFLIADMSSDILSKRFPVEKFGMIYAGAQKNLGPAGVTVVIMRKDVADKANKELPTILSYETHIKNHSLYNTPPTFSIYLLKLVLEWAKDLGGLEELERRNKEKAKLIYDAIDESGGFYTGHAEKDSRSLMNITFTLQNEELTKQFLKEAQEQGFSGLAGHRSVGGCRASAYNAVPLEACKALKKFMNEFQEKQGN
ncbi:3-phosphoserine/phosphohydroxythreonine transaminase [Fictibacillus enclensis]|uniref:3-phosphoserine/phosphohydroxythreonine transaminase n=1 Tax=Fictibacillus enclensis TaxID=1017270 RepID=UPI0025A1E427|nr:3-phosphoserine/phosphohydroxythreonine transaminase [Fictibacillus enclensis]MDM5336852.1 3-phosphoserine/phosphohydroxythreonine transaminase [Fictibacillus enclensis]